MQFNNKFRIFGLIIGVLVLAGLVGVMALTVQRAQQLTSTITRPKATGITWSCTGGSGSSEVGWCGGWGVCHGDCPCGCGGYLPYPGGPTSKDCKPSFGNYICSWDAPNVACHSATKVDCSSKGDQNSCQAVSGCNWTASSDSCANPFSPSYSQPQGQLSGVTPGTFVWTWCDPSVINWSTVYLWNCNPANCNGAFAKADGGGHTNGNISLSNFTMISGGGAVSLQPNTQYWWTLNPNSCASYPSVNCPIGNGPGTGSFTTGAAAPVCPSGQTLCGSTCVNLQTDSNNCRACGGICPSGQTCSSGTCTTTCSGSTPDFCGSACTNKQTDVNNCGACGTVCTTGKVCSSGVCTAPASCVDSQCSDTQKCSNNSCVNVTCPKMPTDGCWSFVISNHACNRVNAADGTACGTAGSGNTCQSGVCTATSTSCSSDLDCSGGNVCAFP